MDDGLPLFNNVSETRDRFLKFCDGNRLVVNFRFALIVAVVDVNGRKRCQSRKASKSGEQYDGVKSAVSSEERRYEGEDAHTMLPKRG